MLSRQFLNSVYVGILLLLSLSASLLIHILIMMRYYRPGLFNTDIPYYKLRGLSGFWMAFFALASLVQLTVNRQIMLQNPDENERDNR